MQILYFVFSVAAFAFAVNALRPPLTARHAALRPPWLPVMLTSELAPMHVVVVVAVTLVAVPLGVFDEPLGVLGLWLSAVAMVLLVVQIVMSARALSGMRSALADITDVPAPRYRWGSVFYPYPYRLPDDLERLDDIEYDDGLRLDLYRSRLDPPVAGPILVHVHGGSWGGGHRRQQAQPLIHEMARRGWLVASVDYPLVPAATFPDQMIALHRAMLWFRHHGADHGGDAGRIFVTGGSAGAHLASLLALSDDEPAWSRRRPGEPAIAGAVTIYGVYDLLDRNGLRDFWPVISRQLIKADPTSEPEKFRSGSPIDRVAPHAPPFLVIHGTNDSLVPIAESEHFADALRAVSDSPVAFARIPGATHAFDVVASLRTQQVVAGIAAFLDHVADR